MEELTPPKKLWNIVRIVLFMIRKRISNQKLLSSFNHLMMKRGKVAMENFSCKPHDAHLSFISPRPREYEFSCSNSPAFPFHLTANKRKHHHRHYNRRNYQKEDDIATVSAVQKLLEMLNSNEPTEASPLVVSGYGRSPLMVRQLRVTDSPFPLRNSEEDHSQVDKEAEEFIERFYEQLRKQKRMAAAEARNQNLLVSSHG